MVMLGIIHHWTFCKDSFLNDSSYKTCQIMDIIVGHSLYDEILKMQIIIIDSKSWNVILFCSLRLHIRKWVWERLRVLSSFTTQKWQRFILFQKWCSFYYNSAYLSQTSLPRNAKHSLLPTHIPPWRLGPTHDPGRDSTAYRVTVPHQCPWLTQG